MIIEKTPKSVTNYRRECAYFDSARDGLSYLLARYAKQKCVVLLPSFIGVSVHEGSGIFDPVKNNNVPYLFYGMDGRLNIDIKSYERVLSFASGHYTLVIVLIVHYFGFVDPRYNYVCQTAKSANAIIIEDEAHALFTDYVDNSCGRQGDYSIFSLHKMLPMHKGGMVRDNINSSLLDEISNRKNGESELIKSFQYDFKAISQSRKRNASILYHRLEYVQGLSFLHENDVMITPQTIPIVISSSIRNGFYSTLNKAGYGVVSLYHTLIGDIGELEFGASIALSHTITNLPVHQDINLGSIESMCQFIKDYMGKRYEEGLL